MIAPRDPAAAVTSSEGSPPLPYLLNIAYLLLIFFSLPWLVVQAVRKGKYREGYAAKFLGLVPRRSGDRVCVWLHAVSVGEVNLLAPLLRTIRQQRPDWECVVSSTTAAGMALAKKKYADLCVFYCPLDFSWAVRTAMRRIRPDALVLAELELWPNLVRAARGKRRPRGGDQRTAERAELRRLSADSFPGGIPAAADRPAGRAGRGLRRTFSQPWAPVRSRST